MEDSPGTVALATTSSLLLLLVSLFAQKLCRKHGTLKVPKRDEEPQDATQTQEKARDPTTTEQAHTCEASSSDDDASPQRVLADLHRSFSTKRTPVRLPDDWLD